MAEVKVFYDQKGNTLTVWFGDPQAEYVCEETGDEVILMKDKSGSVIGFERLNFSVAQFFCCRLRAVAGWFRDGSGLKPCSQVGLRHEIQQSRLKNGKKMENMGVKTWGVRSSFLTK